MDGTLGARIRSGIQALFPGYFAVVLATGIMLLLARKAFPLLEMWKPFSTGFTIFFWEAATWWIPLLSILVIWRHAVFPLVPPATPTAE